jgi:uracil-DNA glycosylase
MRPSELIRELEYLRDLGIPSLVLPEGVQTLAALVADKPRQGASARQGASPRQASKAEARPIAPAVNAPAKPAPATSPAARQEAPATQTPAKRPIAAAAASLPAAKPTEPAPGKPALLSTLLSQQLKLGKNPEAPAAADTPLPAETPFTMFDAIGINPADDSLIRIREDIGDCKRCRLCEGRTNIVFGSGNEQAPLVFVGEGPGEDEDLSGFPFVGRAGQLLTRMIEGTAEKEGIPIKRSDVYICNVVKCRPPKNRNPMADEMEVCGQFLFRQLAVIKPKAICVLGGVAAQALLNTKATVGSLRGEWQKWRDIPLMVTYHPSYLLRSYSPDSKRLVWEDLKKVLHFVYDDPAKLPQRAE